MKNWNWNWSYLQKMSKRPKIQFRIRIRPWNYNTSSCNIAGSAEKGKDTIIVWSMTVGLTVRSS